MKVYKKDTYIICPRNQTLKTVIDCEQLWAYIIFTQIKHDKNLNFIY